MNKKKKNEVSLSEIRSVMRALAGALEHSTDFKKSQGAAKDLFMQLFISAYEIVEALDSESPQIKP